MIAPDLYLVPIGPNEPRGIVVLCTSCIAEEEHLDATPVVYAEMECDDCGRANYAADARPPAQRHRSAS